MKVYLAGGMRSEWRQLVKETVQAPLYYDPCHHGLKNSKNYTSWGLAKIRESDVVLAYLEETNPGGVGMAAEIGYAHALGKLVIFINEQSDNRYFDFIEHCSDFVSHDLDEGIDILRSLLS